MQQNPTGKNSAIRLLIHTEFGIIVAETTDKDEISAAIEAMAAVRANKRKAQASGSDRAA